MVFNKLDTMSNGDLLGQFLDLYPHSVGVSATEGQGISELLTELGSRLRPKREFVQLRIPHHLSALIARLYSVGQVLERDYTGETAFFKARVPPQYLQEFASFTTTESGENDLPA